MLPADHAASPPRPEVQFVTSVRSRYSSPLNGSDSEKIPPPRPPRPPSAPQEPGSQPSSWWVQPPQPASASAMEHRLRLRVPPPT